MRGRVLMVVVGMLVLAGCASAAPTENVGVPGDTQGPPESAAPSGPAGTYTFTSEQFAVGRADVVRSPVMRLSGFYVATYRVAGSPGCHIAFILATPDGRQINGAGANVDLTTTEASGTFAPKDPNFGDPNALGDGDYVMEFTENSCDSWTITLAPTGAAATPMPTSPEITPTPVAMASATPTDAPTGEWRSYTSARYGFVADVPVQADHVIDTGGPCDHVYNATAPRPNLFLCELGAISSLDAAVIAADADNAPFPQCGRQDGEMGGEPAILLSYCGRSADPPQNITVFIAETVHNGVRYHVTWVADESDIDGEYARFEHVVASFRF